MTRARQVFGCPASRATLTHRFAGVQGRRPTGLTCAETEIDFLDRTARVLKPRKPKGRAARGAPAKVPALSMDCCCSETPKTGFARIPAISDRKCCPQKLLGEKPLQPGAVAVPAKKMCVRDRLKRQTRKQVKIGGKLANQYPRC